MRSSVSGTLRRCRKLASMTPSTRRVTRRLRHESHNRYSGKDPFPQRKMLTDADPHDHVNQQQYRCNAKATPAARTRARLAVNQGATTQQEGICSQALGSSSRLKYLTLRHKRHNSSATIVAQAWVSSGASPAVTNFTRMCTSLGAGLRRPTKPPRLHLDAPQRENDNSRTCVGALDHLLRRHKHPKEVILLGRWATQADEHSKSSPPPRHKRHNANMTTAARAWAILGASPGAANATRRCTSLSAGLHKPTKRQRRHPHFATRTTTRKRQHPQVRGRAWARARAPRTTPGGVPPWALGSTSRPNINFLTPTSRQAWGYSGRRNLHVLSPTSPQAQQREKTTAARAWAIQGASPGAASATRKCTSLGVGLLRHTKPQRPHPDAPQRENDNSRTCVGEPGSQPGRHELHKEVYLLGRWAPQALHPFTSSPPTITSAPARATTTQK